MKAVNLNYQRRYAYDSGESPYNLTLMYFVDEFELQPNGQRRHLRVLGPMTAEQAEPYLLHEVACSGM